METDCIMRCLHWTLTLVCAFSSWWSLSLRCAVVFGTGDSIAPASDPRGLRIRKQARHGETRSGRRNSNARPQLRLRHQVCEFLAAPSRHRSEHLARRTSTSDAHARASHGVGTRRRANTGATHAARRGRQSGPPPCRPRRARRARAWPQAVPRLSGPT